MKKLSFSPRLSLFLMLCVGIALLSAAIGSPTATAQTAATLTPTVEVVDALEVGSTDGILVLAILIALAIFIPILASGVLWKKKDL